MKPGTVFVLAIALAALVASMVYRQLHSRDLALEEAMQKRAAATTPVVVARTTIPVGTKLTAAQLTTIAWTAGSEPEGAVADPNTLVGNVVRTTIEKNHPVVHANLAGDGPGLLPLMIPAGMRAISVKVDTVTGVSGFITPGSRVDVLVASGGSGDSGNEEARSKLILQNVKVLATGKSIEQADDAPVEVPTVTLLVTPEQAETMTLANRYEPVQLALRSFRDDDVVATHGVSAEGLFARHAGAAAPGPPEDEPGAPEREGYTIEVLLRGKSTRQPVF